MKKMGLILLVLFIVGFTVFFNKYGSFYGFFQAHFLDFSHVEEVADLGISFKE